MIPVISMSLEVPPSLGEQRQECGRCLQSGERRREFSVSQKSTKVTPMSLTPVLLKHPTGKQHSLGGWTFPKWGNSSAQRRKEKCDRVHSLCTVPFQRPCTGYI